MKVPFADLHRQYIALKMQIDAAIAEVIRDSSFIRGPHVELFEKKFAKLIGVSNCVSCANGTDAIYIVLKGLGIGPGDEVITTAHSWISTSETITQAGARVVFVDTEPDTFCIDPKKIRQKITKKTKAIMPVSLYGQTADMDQINAIAAQHNLPVIEDAAQSFGATYKGKQSGNLSTVAGTSFFPAKPLGCYGDGGAIFTNDDNLAKIMREIRVHGQEKRYYHTRLGINGRLDTLQCAILIEKLKIFPSEVTARHAIAKKYDQLLAGKVKNISVMPERTCIYAQYTIDGIVTGKPLLNNFNQKAFLLPFTIPFP